MEYQGQPDIAHLRNHLNCDFWNLWSHHSLKPPAILSWLIVMVHVLLQSSLAWSWPVTADWWGRLWGPWTGLMLGTRGSTGPEGVWGAWLYAQLQGEQRPAGVSRHPAPQWLATVEEGLLGRVCFMIIAKTKRESEWGIACVLPKHASSCKTVIYAFLRTLSVLKMLHLIKYTESRANVKDVPYKRLQFWSLYQTTEAMEIWIQGIKAIFNLNLYVLTLSLNVSLDRGLTLY